MLTSHGRFFFVLMYGVVRQIRCMNCVDMVFCKFVTILLFISTHGADVKIPLNQDNIN